MSEQQTESLADATLSTPPPVIDIEVKKAPEEKKIIPSPIHADRGALAPRNSSELMRTVAMIAKGGGFPAIFESIEKQIAAYNLAVTLMGKQWQLAINNMYFIKGKLAIYGELPGTIAERTGEVVEKKVKIYTKDYTEICLENKNLDATVWAAVCIIQRKGREKKEFFYTLQDAETAGQYPATKPEYKDNKRTGKMIENDDSPWMKHTKVMLMRKAMNLAVKFEFPESLVGVPIAETDFDEAPDLRDVTNSNKIDKADLLNNKFSASPTSSAVSQ